METESEDSTIIKDWREGKESQTEKLPDTSKPSGGEPESHEAGEPSSDSEEDISLATQDVEEGKTQTTPKGKGAGSTARTATLSSVLKTPTKKKPGKKVTKRGQSKAKQANKPQSSEGTLGKPYTPGKRRTRSSTHIEKPANMATFHTREEAAAHVLLDLSKSGPMNRFFNKEGTDFAPEIQALRKLAVECAKGSKMGEADPYKVLVIDNQITKVDPEGESHAVCPVSNRGKFLCNLLHER